ncbi:MAG: hypothetical protein OXC63_04160 [Aestuariivita sp.]|nr:hypothetical protein [Aestuariivita sp.]MCY4345723.1 hypothetical protein [Aestuariivita sp.]
MQQLTLICALIALIATAWLWGFDGSDWLVQSASLIQKETQAAMASVLRALRRGEPGAVTTLLALCFVYGVAHSVGPGHGKMMIGTYGVLHRVSAIKLSVLALLSSLAQTLTAIILVYGGLWILEWGRARLEKTVEEWLTPASFGLISLLGLVLAGRGFRRLMIEFSSGETKSDPEHSLAGNCCQHKHAPTAADIASVQSLRDVAIMIGAIAARPCTGAVFLLFLTAQMGIGLVGIAGAVSMSVGTAIVTIFVAIAAVTLRQSTFLFVGGTRVQSITALLELAFGLVVAAVFMHLTLQLS